MYAPTAPPYAQTKSLAFVVEAKGSFVQVAKADVALACSPTCTEAIGNTVTVTVNAPPVANADTFTTPEDTPLVLTPLANDTYSDGTIRIWDIPPYRPGWIEWIGVGLSVLTAALFLTVVRRWPREAADPPRGGKLSRPARA
jgi:hypothetical protein